jgi:predicted  nucleic acid-binding Zn-ribbon protein
VRNQREYGALLQEIDVAKDQIKGLEELALGAMERQEEAESKLAEERQSFEELDTRYAVELEKWEGQKPQVAAEAERLRGRVEVLRERLPRSIQGQYERIADRYGGEALALIVKIDRGGRGANMWHCGACNYRVRPQAIVQIQNHGTLEFCDTCKRILYLDEVPD